MDKDLDFLELDNSIAIYGNQKIMKKMSSEAKSVLEDKLRMILISHIYERKYNKIPEEFQKLNYKEIKEIFVPQIAGGINVVHFLKFIDKWQKRRAENKTNLKSMLQLVNYNKVILPDLINYVQSVLCKNGEPKTSGLTEFEKFLILLTLDSMKREEKKRNISKNRKRINSDN
uniref:Uncharacterized protein n=1 Tax=Parastrongyloides trichosuri TaxID=131310 RepID=A0A0N4ZYS0_PARTI